MQFLWYNGLQSIRFYFLTALDIPTLCSDSWNVAIYTQKKP